MNTATALAQGATQTNGIDVNHALEAARNQVENRFLEGGTVLLSVMDVLNRLLTSLDQVTRSLDNNETSDTGADLTATVDNLLALPAQEAARQADMAILSEAAGNLRTHVADMQETMRYLRTFAVTVKITGAGIAEFAGFAEEILERIQSGTTEVNTFATQLATLEKNVRAALSLGSGLSRSYEATVPAVAGALQTDAQKIGAHRRNLGVIAREVSTIARGIQMKVASTLSALQIGDITRQRIEHVQSTFGLLQEFLAGPEGATLDGDARARLNNVILHLTAAQMNDMCGDFDRESRNVVNTIASFAGDTREILRLRDSMSDKLDHGDSGNIMRALEESVSKAQLIVAQVENASSQADQVSRSTLGTAASLFEAIGNIRAVKTDIHYMALNTNLRCSRMGEEGRSINVVTAELRIFAAKLDESADVIVNGLPQLQAVAGRMAASQGAPSESLGSKLSSAIGNIRSAADSMEQELAVLSEHGREVADKIGLSIAKLDFGHELGDVLSRCADILNDLAGDTIADISDITPLIAPLDRKIYKLYTMMQERTIHREIIAADESAPVVSVEAPRAQSDEELFDDALF